MFREEGWVRGPNVASRKNARFSTFGPLTLTLSPVYEGEGTRVSPKIVSAMHPLAADLDHLLTHTSGVWDDVRGARVFITGGTGFFGAWLLESLVWANDRLRLGASAVVLTRNPDRFKSRFPALAQNHAISFHTGDVTDFHYPPGSFSHVIHAATESSTTLGRDDPRRMLDTIVLGTQHVLSFAQSAGARRFLFTSSGAVYGRQPADLPGIPEDYRGGPDCTDAASCYGEGKRVAELHCVLAAKESGLGATIARCFAFIGPHLPIDAHFAAGNFVRDALAGGPIRINGDGTTVRSYLYAADLAGWLWTLLVRGAPGRAYNVGSPVALSIADLARAIASAVSPAPQVLIAKQPTPGALPDRYVPDCTRAAAELGLRPTIDLPSAIKGTIAWHRAVR